MKHLILVALFSAAIIASAGPNEQTTLSGIVIQRPGFPIVGATVTVDWNAPRRNGPAKTSSPNATQTTDSYGQFSVQLVPGFYDVCAHAEGFVPICETVAIGDTEVRHKLFLRANPLILEEIRTRNYDSKWD
jgi:hypothetical protein